MIELPVDFVEQILRNMWLFIYSFRKFLAIIFALLIFQVLLEWLLDIKIIKFIFRIIFAAAVIGFIIWALTT